MVRDHGAPVNNASVDVAHPCAVHDGQGAQYEHPTHLTFVHQVVCRPQGRERLTSSGVVKTERSAVQSHERGGLYLVSHWYKLAGPVVALSDGRGHIFDSEILEYACLVKPPVHSHLIDAVLMTKDFVFGDDAVLAWVARA